MMVVIDHHAGAVEGYLRTAPPASSLPWRQASFAVLGIEASGPDPHSDQLVSVACVPVEGGKAIIGEASERTVRSGRMEDSLDRILEALTGRVLVAHGAPVHVGFLSAALNRIGVCLREPTLDTAVLADRVPRLAAAEDDRPQVAVDAAPSLPTAAAGMGLPVHRPHEASGEALTAAQLFMALASHLDQAHPQSVGSLARLCSKNGGCNRGVSRSSFQ
jgi:DNA polymerase-3 subunit epsilon